MRPLIRLFFFASLAASAPLVFGQQPPAPGVPAAASRDVRIELQIVSMPEHLAWPLVPALHDDKQIEKAYAQIQELIAGKKATLVAWPMLTTHSGQRAVTEQAVEIRYPTEFGEYAIRQELPRELQQRKLADEVESKGNVGVPNAWDTRNAGVKLEVDPVVSPDGQLIQLYVAHQHVRLLGYKKVTIEDAEKKTRVSVEQPEFHTTKVTTSLDVRNGQRVLLGLYKTKQPDDHVELFILKASAAKLGR
ncbi:MAG: type II and III secretion system protein [Verrucomicrobiota bacterium]|nr:type II and III secretion system protein [Verrucomicrobiota bacterium]